jgi:enamine deaminase RidA (YjgF/YER057c/UK114 family)
MVSRIQLEAGMTAGIERIGVTRRWSDIVLHGQTAYFVEVADDPHQSFTEQVHQILRQIDIRLAQIGSGRNQLLQVLIYLSDLSNGPALNEIWDVWIPEGHAPSRACVQAGLAPNYLIEMVITAAWPDRS